MWMMHFLHHLRDPDGKKYSGGTAGFVMATGKLSNGEVAHLEVRKAMVEHGYVDCIVQLTGQLFANTQIPCCLWFSQRTEAAEAASAPAGRTRSSSSTAANWAC